MSVGVAQSPGGCNCPSIVCNVIFTVLGCAGLPLAGATVSVAGGPNGITNAAGQVLINVGSAGMRAVTVSHPRFLAVTVTRQIACGSTQLPISLVTPVAGYACWTGCAAPLATTLATSLPPPYDVFTYRGGFVWSSFDGLYQIDGLSCRTFGCDFPALCFVHNISCPPALEIDIYCNGFFNFMITE